MYSEVQTITPEVAQHLLSLNSTNRTVTESNVRSFAKQMLDGEFMLTHQGIAIGKSGRLLDGQHRLLAVIRTGITVQMMVTVDVEDDSFAVLDTGRSRRASDTLSISGGMSAITLAATIRLAIRYEEVPGKVWAGLTPISNKSTLVRYESERDTWDALVKLSLKNQIPRILVAAPFACMGYLALNAGIDMAEVADFAKDLRHGAYLVDGDPVLAFRNKISFAGRASSQARLADYIKLLNARTSLQPLKIFKSAPFPPMPTILGRKD
jgi:hypothetical protein